MSDLSNALGDIGKFLFGEDKPATPTYQAPAPYQSFDPASYGGGLGQQYLDVTKQNLLGKLTPEEQQVLNQQFQANLAQVREGSYGMPISAAKQMEMNAASQNALQGTLLGQQRQQLGLQSALPYLGFGQQNTRGLNSYNLSSTGMENQFNTSVYDSLVKQAAADGGLLSKVAPGLAYWGMNTLFPGAPAVGQLAGKIADESALTSQKSGQDLGSYKQYNPSSPYTGDYPSSNPSAYNSWLWEQ